MRFDYWLLTKSISGGHGEDSARMITQDTDATGEYGSVQPVDTASSTNNENNNPLLDPPQGRRPG